MKGNTMIIAITNEKGGSGKTTLAVNLASYYATLGDNILLVDSDPQGSVRSFVESRMQEGKESPFTSIALLGASMITEIKKLQQHYDCVIIDTGGRDSVEMRGAMSIANISIIPIIPSQYDIAVLNKMIELHRQSQVFNPNTKALFLISKAFTNPKLQKNIRDLQDFIQKRKQKDSLDSMYLLDSILYERIAYQNAVKLGLGIHEYAKDTDNALIEFKKVCCEIFTFCKDKHYKQSDTMQKENS